MMKIWRSHGRVISIKRIHIPGKKVATLSTCIHWDFLIWNCTKCHIYNTKLLIASHRSLHALSSSRNKMVHLCVLDLLENVKKHNFVYFASYHQIFSISFPMTIRSITWWLKLYIALIVLWRWLLNIRLSSKIVSLRYWSRVHGRLVWMNWK